MSLLLLFQFTIPIVDGTASGACDAETGIALGTFTPAPEVIVIVLPIQTTIALTLPIGQTPPPVIPPWVVA
jgi:hypothetical protein